MGRFATNHLERLYLTFALDEMMLGNGQKYPPGPSDISDQSGILLTCVGGSKAKASLDEVYEYEGTVLPYHVVLTIKYLTLPYEQVNRPSEKTPRACKRARGGENGTGKEDRTDRGHSFIGSLNPQRLIK